MSSNGGESTGRKRGQNGGGRRPVDSRTRARVVKLAQQVPQLSRNAIAREVGLSPSTVSRIVHDELPGFTFDRSKTREAVKARQVDLKAARAELATLAVVQARDLFAAMTSPHEVTHWDKEGTMHRETIDRPTSGDVRNYAVAIGVLVDKHAALVRIDSDDRDLPAVERWLQHVMGGGDTATVVAA